MATAECWAFNAAAATSERRHCTRTVQQYCTRRALLHTNDPAARCWDQKGTHQSLEVGKAQEELESLDRAVVHR